MNVGPLLTILITMSGLPKRKYQKLDSPPSMQMTDISERSSEKDTTHGTADTSSLTQLETDESTTEFRAAKGPEEKRNPKLAGQSIDQLFSGSSSFDQDNGSTEHISSQFQEVFHRMSSSQSESWFTASSIMEEVNSNNTPDMSTQTEPIGGGLIRPNQQDQFTSTTTDVQQSGRTERTPSGTVLRTRKPSKVHGLSMSEIEIPGPPGRSFVLRPHKSSLTKEPHRSLIVPQIENLDLKSTSPTSPAKILRTKWKRLFGQRRSPPTSPTTQTGHDKPQRIQRSLSHHSTIIEVSNEPLAYACMPRNVVLIREKEKLIDHSIQTTQSVCVEDNQKTVPDTHLSPTHVNCRPYSDGPDEYAGIKFPKAIITEKMSQYPVIMEKPQISATRISLPSTRSLMNMERRGEFSRSEGLRTNKMFVRQTSDATDANSSQDHATNTNDLEQLDSSHVPDEYKTSFEREQDDPENLLVREAHVGALALAWASGTRKSRRQAERAHSEHQATTATTEENGSSSRISSAFRLYSQRRKCETEYMESSRDAMRILAKFRTDSTRDRSLKSLFKRESTQESHESQDDGHVVESVVRGPTKAALTPLYIKTPEHILHNVSGTAQFTSTSDRTSKDPVGDANSPKKHNGSDRGRRSASSAKSARTTAELVQNKLFSKRRTGSTRALNMS
ncbi:unnamed protein product, partial [Echinostoma caproni]|uniref:CaMBD domain-containing protein n=1 Tax=Echinostoma caproni TaxID=27848 RepID=A0A183ATJ0_9TREM